MTSPLASIAPSGTRLRLRRPVPRRCGPAAAYTVCAALLLLAAGGAAQGQQRQFRIVPESSALRVIVHRQGVFAVLAHDHVLLARDFAGRITLDGADVTRSAVTLRVGSAAFEVDPQKERDRLGFISELTEGNRQSVKENLMGPEVLNAAAFPAITAASERVTGRLPGLTLTLRLKIRDREQVLTVPVKVAVTAEGLTAGGEAEFKQTDFGITPYQTLMGAIAVEDRVVVQFDIVAAPQP